MLRSMTGYSISHIENERFSLTVSVKSINHRFLDAQLRLPPAADFFEPRARRLLKERIARGHVEVTVNLDRYDCPEVKLNHPLLGAYVHACRELKKEYDLTQEPDLVALLKMPGVLGGGNEISGPARESIEDALEQCLAEALDRLNEMREREGATVGQDLQARLQRLEGLCAQVEELARSLASVFQERLKKRVRELTHSGAIEPARVAQEVVLLALRADISEEVTRFKSHVAQAKHLLKEGKEIGKKLDFLFQEMNREANTILAKTADVPGCGGDIASDAMEMRVEVEKLREQVQNVE